MTICAALLLSLLLADEIPGFTPGEFHVTLLAPLTTKFNHKGDIVSAKVVTPVSLEGGILEGEVADTHAGSPRSTLQFRFHTLHAAGSAMPVSVQLTGVANSKRQAGKDEEGAAVENDAGTPAASEHFSLLHRQKDKPVRNLHALKLSTPAKNLSFAPGSELILQVEAVK